MIKILLRRLLVNIKSGKITFVFDNGYKMVFSGEAVGPEGVINVHSIKGLQRLGTAGYLGLAEGFLAREWTTPSLPNLFAFGTENQASLDKSLTGGRLVSWVNEFSRLFRKNTRVGSRKNIADHYDLGNSFFAKWLDPSLTYSSALFEDNEYQSLEVAQKSKYCRILNKLDIKANQTVLEIGCGWGGFAEICARNTGAKISAVTISKEQHDFASRRFEKVGLGQKVEVLLQDYRDIKGKFDRIVSIEMLEAVGEEYWSTFFQKLSDNLTEGGMAMIQVITLPDEQFEDYRSTTDFIQKYIFPGGMLICPAKIKEHSLAANLRLKNEFMMGKSYAQTLDLWRDNFLRNWQKISTLGFDERFKRMWEYYLVYTSAGFKAGAIDVGQFCFSKP
jgi:cyclopropane-fatty-acyl-phospholipid synthase